MMRVLHIITWLQKAAGTSVFCGELANGLVAAGHDVIIAVVNPTQTDCYPLNPRIKIISIGSLLLSSGSSSVIPRPSIIHIHALWSPILHKVSTWAYKSNVPIVWSPHGMLTPWAMNNKRWKKMLGWCLYQRSDLAKADLLHATAQSEVGDIRRMGLKNKIVVAPLGVKTAFITQTRREAGKILLFVSRVQRKKGLLNLAKAWAMLPQQVRAGWHIRVVGPDQEGHSQEVRTECERLGISADWDFIGPKYGEELQNEYAGADLFVLPTHSENFGSVVVEALVHKIPVITTKGAPWKELEDYNCGWWVDVDVGALKQALQDAMTLTNEERHAMGERGRKLIEKKYTWDAVVNTMLKGYEEVLNGRT